MQMVFTMTYTTPSARSTARFANPKYKLEQQCLMWYEQRKGFPVFQIKQPSMPYPKAPQNNVGHIPKHLRLQSVIFLTVFKERLESIWAGHSV